MGAWIHMVPVADATGPLKQAYEKVKTPHGTVDNVMRVHSLRPHTMEGHVALYRSVLHHPENKLPLWFLECVAVATSLVNRCDYSFSHHWSNARNLLRDEGRAQQILSALRDDHPQRAFDGKELALIEYARALTRAPGGITRAVVDAPFRPNLAQSSGFSRLQAEKTASGFASPRPQVWICSIQTDFITW